MESREFGLDGIGLEYRFVGKSDILEVLLIRDCVGDSFSFSYFFFFLGLINLLLRRRGMENLYSKKYLNYTKSISIYIFIYSFIIQSIYFGIIIWHE